MRRTYFCDSPRALKVISQTLTDCGVSKRKKGCRVSESKERYMNIVAAFDIETTTIQLSEKDYQAVMYIWQFQIGPEITVIGRTWGQYISFVQNIQMYIPEGSKLLVFVHNLSYEFQYLRGVFAFASEDVFCLHSRKVLRATCGKLEYRCSYLLSNRSLKKWGIDLHVKHIKEESQEDENKSKKRVFDYRKERFSDTSLTCGEYIYCIVDVITLEECVRKTLELENDDLYTLPYTSTGFVRRDMKKAMSPLKPTLLERLKMEEDVFQLAREAFRGGNCHANRYYAGMIVEDIKSSDRTSSYIHSICFGKYPMSPFRACYDLSLKHVEENIQKGFCILMRIHLENVRLRDNSWGFPYIPSDKCRNIRKPWMDNGRILSADALDITVTELDYQIIKEEYEFEISVVKVYISRGGLLPERFRRVALEYFKRKTALKGIDDLLYMLSKNKLNALFGMMAERPDKPDIVIEGWEYVEESPNLAERLKKKYLPYSWGVWTTANARWDLEQGLKAAGIYGIYTDTDSVKHLGELDIGSYNQRLIREGKKTGYEAFDQKGNSYYLGVFEEDAEYKKFITWGAKKYAYVDSKGKLGITIAGVDKKEGAKELERKGGLEALIPDHFIFEQGGGLRAIYNDSEPYIVTYKGRKLTITSNTALVPDVYAFGLSGDYERLLSAIGNRILRF